MAGFKPKIRVSYPVLSKNTPQEPMEYTRYSVGYNNANTYRDTKSRVLAPIVGRIAIDAANIPIRHIRVDEDGNFKENIKSELNDRLTWVANEDQSGVAFVQDTVTTMLDVGCSVMVPTETSHSPWVYSSYDIWSMRVGQVVDWMNYAVNVDVYDIIRGDRRQKVLPKWYVAIAYNPFYIIMNRPNSTLERLIEKRRLLDLVDNKTNGPNLDLLLQLPYALQNDKQHQEAMRRAQQLENQLFERVYGIAYVGATEKIHQLNRPVSNSLPDQVAYLTDMLYKELGLTPSIMDGTAGPEEQLSYYNRTVLPILNSVIQGMEMKFISKNARTRGEALRAFPSIFKMVSLDKLADAADKFTRNEILSSNELRSVMGLRRKEDPDADALRNKNLNKPTEEVVKEKPQVEDKQEKEV